MIRTVCYIAIVLQSISLVASADNPISLTTENGRRWYRGNMHTHSHWSDGDDYLESIALWYRNRQYQFLVFTDHNVLATTERWVKVDKTKGGRTAYDKLKKNFPDWIEQRGEGNTLEVRLRQFPEVAAKLNQPGEFLLIQGEEISDRAEGKPLHLNVHNVEQLIPPQGGRTVFETIENNVRAVQAQRESTGRPMIVHLNHPNFGFAVTAEQLMRVRGERFFEVYNGHPAVANKGKGDHPGTERIWDIILSQRIAALDMPIMYGLAVDDGHEYHHIPSRASEPGRGWVEVLAKELTAEALIASLEAGEFYASTGVKLESIVSDSKQISVKVVKEPDVEFTIDFIGTRKSANLTGEPITDADGNPKHITYRYSNDIGKVLKTVKANSASYTFQGDEYYIRARVTSSKLHPNPAESGDFEQAWVQPVLGPAAP